MLVKGAPEVSQENISCLEAAITNAVKLDTLYKIGKPTLTLKHRETHGCVVSTVATDALVLKHQAISIHNAD